MAELPSLERGTVAILSTGGGAPHAIPVSNWVVHGRRVLLALARRRESLARMRREPRVAFTVLAEGVALTAYARASVLVEALPASDQVAAVALDVDDIQDHAQPTFTIDRGVSWHWDDDTARERDAAIRAELAALAARVEPGVAARRSARRDAPAPSKGTVGDWHRRRTEAAARTLADRGADDDLGRAAAVLRAADEAVYGVVPREDYERLALDYSAMRVRALQDEDLLERALEALDQVAAGAAKQARDSAFATAAELRALLAARSDDEAQQER